MTIFGKINHLHASNEIHFLPVQERYTHALSRNTNCLTIDGQVCFYRRLFTDAVKLRGCISWSWGALIGLHGVPNYSSRQSWPPLWIVSVHVTYWRHSTALWVPIGALPRLRLPTHPPPIDSISDTTGAEKTIWKTSSSQVASRISYEMIAIKLHYSYKISGVTVLCHRRSTVH